MDELITLSDTNEACGLCKLVKVDDFRLGPLFQREGFVAHYYCVLFSNKVPQRGKDQEGIMGFLISDVKAEVERVKRTICAYCKKPSASITCAFKKCRLKFHFPCGIEKGSLHQFHRGFKSYCRKHRPVQQIPEKVMNKAEEDQIPCAICYESVDHRSMTETIWANCCCTTWYHRDCLQMHALSSGYFFKCAICNNHRKFKFWVQKFGIYVPRKDASWELEPNAFGELTRQYSQCDAENCKCPRGRECNVDDTMWEIVLCGSCGSQGMHVMCGGLKFHRSMWQCQLCKKVTAKVRSERKRCSTKAIRVDNCGNTLKDESESQSDENCATSSGGERVSAQLNSDSADEAKRGTKTCRKRKRADAEDGEKPVISRNKRRKVFGSRAARRRVDSTVRQKLSRRVDTLSVENAENQSSSNEGQEVEESVGKSNSCESADNDKNLCTEKNVVMVSDDDEDSDVEVILDEEVDSPPKLSIFVHMALEVSDGNESLEEGEERAAAERRVDAIEENQVVQGTRVPHHRFVGGESNKRRSTAGFIVSKKTIREGSLNQETLERVRSCIQMAIESELKERERTESRQMRKSRRSNVSCGGDSDGGDEIEVIEVIRKNEKNRLASQGRSGSSEEVIEIE